MTLARPVLPPMPARGRRWGVLLGVAVVVGVIAYLAFSSVGSALVYYVTPTELLARGDAQARVESRLASLEQQLAAVNDRLRFQVTGVPSTSERARRFQVILGSERMAV